MKRFILTATLAGACATTEVLGTWTKPGADLNAIERVAVLVPLNDATVRRNAEQQVASSFTRISAVPSHRVAPEGIETKDEALAAAIEQGGFDAVVVMRVHEATYDADWEPRSWTGPYYGFTNWPLYSPGYVSVDRFVRVETNVYALPSRELVWSASTRTRNPRDLPGLIDEATEAVRAAFLDAARTPVSKQGRPQRAHERS